MKLIEQQLKVHADTFAPELILTISMPLELMQDTVAVGGEELAYKKLGDKFIELLKSLKESI